MTSKHKKVMLIKNSLTLGCLLVIDGTTYRIIHVHRKRPTWLSSSKQLYLGKWPCLGVEPQFAKLWGKQGRRFLELGHARLQHGHRGVMHLCAEVSRFGRVGGANRWLRVPTNFPNLPAAEGAHRVSIPHQKRTRPAHCFKPQQQLDYPALADVETVTLSNFDLVPGGGGQ